MQKLSNRSSDVAGSLANDPPEGEALEEGGSSAPAHVIRRMVEAALGQHGVMHRRDLAELKLKRHPFRRLVEQGFLTAVDTDVFAVGAVPDSWHRQLMAGALQLGDQAYATGEASAALHGFDTFRPGKVEFLVPARQRNRTVAVGRVRSTSAPILPDDVDRKDGIPCTSPARTIFDLASVVSRKRLEHAIDSALRDGLVTEPELLEVLTRLRRSGRNGVTRLEEALGIAHGPVAHSVLERRFLRLAAQHGLPTPRSQVVHLDAEQRFVARVDFQFEHEVIAEVDGHRFHSTRAQRQRDNERRNALMRQGYCILVFTYEDVRDRQQYVAREVRAALATRTHHRSA